MAFFDEDYKVETAKDIISNNIKIVKLAPLNYGSFIKAVLGKELPTETEEENIMDKSVVDYLNMSKVIHYRAYPYNTNGGKDIPENADHFRYTPAGAFVHSPQELFSREDKLPKVAVIYSKLMKVISSDHLIQVAANNVPLVYFYDPTEGFPSRREKLSPYRYRRLIICGTEKAGKSLLGFSNKSFTTFCAVVEIIPVESEYKLDDNNFYSPVLGIVTETRIYACTNNYDKSSIIKFYQRIVDSNDSAHIKKAMMNVFGVEWTAENDRGFKISKHFLDKLKSIFQ